MASKRELKKYINYMVYDVVDECYSIQLFDQSKEESTDKFIDEVADFQEQIMSEIKKARKKADFRSIREKIQKINEEWIKKLNALA